MRYAYITFSNGEVYRIKAEDVARVYKGTVKDNDALAYQRFIEEVIQVDQVQLNVALRYCKWKDLKCYANLVRYEDYDYERNYTNAYLGRSD